MQVLTEPATNPRQKDGAMHVIGSLADILLKVRLLDCCCLLFGMFCTSSVAKIVRRSLTFVVYDLNLSHLEKMALCMSLAR